MKNTTTSSVLYFLFFTIILYALNLSLSGQENSMVSSALPENIKQIVSLSCIPCHTTTGGILSRSKLNLTEWAQYSAEMQKAKASKMYSEVKKGEMPPKIARETRPEIIPTKEQLAIIKTWADSF
jgi:hypothetical protein